MPDYHVKRCFVALPLDEVAIADLEDLAVRAAIDAMKPTRPQNFHVTLKFLGDVDDPDQPRLIDALRRATIDHAAFEMRLTSVQYLPDARRPRVLAAVAEGSPAVTRLFESVEEQAYALGFPREGRAYRPHITLGRFRRPPGRVCRLDDLDPSSIIFPVNRVVLMQSILDHTGPSYMPLADFPLRPAETLPTAT